MIVRIKTWADMEKEYGLDSLDAINVEEGFTREMEESIPDDRIIEIEKDVYHCHYNWHSVSGEWCISADMIADRL